MNLYWTEHPASGWRLVREQDGTWRAEEIKGPRALTAATLNGLVNKLEPDDLALRRRFTEEQIRAAATSSGCDPDAISTTLRTLA